MQMKLIETLKPRIYVACLASYKNGTLYGRWIAADQDLEDIHAEIAAMLKASPMTMAEEWAIHDYEGFGEIRLSEYSVLERVSVLASLLKKHGDAFSVWYVSQDAYTLEDQELEERFLEQWQGVHDSKVAFADQLLEETGQADEIPEWARNYFNLDAYARDLELGGDYTFASHNGQTYVFSNY